MSGGVTGAVPAFGLSLAFSIRMSPTNLDSLLRDATIKAIDGIAKKLSKAERSAESNVARLLEYWNDMTPENKEQAAGIAVATISTAVTAIIALRGKSKKPRKKGGKSLVRAVAKKLG